MAPAQEELNGKTHLLIIPDGLLHTLPFQALRDGNGKCLIEHHAVSYAPSVTAVVKMGELADGRQKKDRLGQRGQLLAVGRPLFGSGLKDLPATGPEVNQIAALFKQAEVLEGEKATKKKVAADMPRMRYVHFATHGLLNETAPLYSAIALSNDSGRDDGLLEARELLDMDLHAELVVLSACQTALGQQVNGEGVLGLTWALFVAGTPSTVVTQWSVADESTSTLMVDFYRRLLPGAGTEEISKAEALRQAQLRLMKEGSHKHPYYWAPFVLVGDWR